MIVGMLLFAQLSASCASGDPVQTLAAVAKAESSFDTLVINDNANGSVYHPANEDTARRLAYALIVERGHSVDLGLMQINSGNLPTLGLSIGDAFDACHSIAAGARILKDDYQHGLRIAFSRYNTGRDAAGFSNGYVARVEAAAQSLPAIDGIALQASGNAVSGVSKPAPAPVARSWDAWAQDDQDSAVVPWDVSHTESPATSALPAAAPPAVAAPNPTRPPLERVVMLQSIGTPETP